MPLSDAEVRVLGALIEKERTTPDAYPLSTLALHAACNQRTNRDPVTDLHLQEVNDALQRLRDRGLAATVQTPGDRVPKHRHLAARAYDVDDRELALLAVLMLRGPQTPGELRQRSERYVAFPDVASVTTTLARLAARATPLVRDLGRAPGQSQERWVHALGVDEDRQRPRARPAGAGHRHAHDGGAPGDPAAGARPGAADQDGAADLGAAAATGLAERLTALEDRVADLERRLAEHDGV